MIHTLHLIKMSLFYYFGSLFSFKLWSKKPNLSSFKMSSPWILLIHRLVAFEIFFYPLEPMVGSGSLARLKTSLPSR